MNKIALIESLNEKKLGFKLAKNIDKESQLFNLSVEYAKQIAKEVYILNSTYGIIKEEDYNIEQYENIEFKSEIEQKLWSLEVLNQLNKVTNIHEDEYMILANKKYYKNYMSFLNKVNTPLVNLCIEDKINILKEKLDDDKEKISHGEKLHILFNSMKRYDYNNFEEIPFDNGIFVVLDKKEKYKDMDRIVKIGAHINEDQLIHKIKKNYEDGAKDNSFLRKSIGKSILSYNKNEYLYIWNINFSDKLKQDKYINLRNLDLELSLEKKITQYIKERLEFVCFEVKDLKERIKIRDELISTIYHDEDFTSSNKWLGNYSNTESIKESKMWVSKGLDKAILNEEEVRHIITLCVKSNEKNMDFNV